MTEMLDQQLAYFSRFIVQHPMRGILESDHPAFYAEIGAE